MAHVIWRAPQNCLRPLTCGAAPRCPFLLQFSQVPRSVIALAAAPNSPPPTHRPQLRATHHRRRRPPLRPGRPCPRRSHTARQRLPCARQPPVRPRSTPLSLLPARSSRTPRRGRASPSPTWRSSTSKEASRAADPPAHVPYPPLCNYPAIPRPPLRPRPRSPAPTSSTSPAQVLNLPSLPLRPRCASPFLLSLSYHAC